MTKQATNRPWTVQINSHSHYLGSYQIWDRDGNSLTDSDKEDEEIRSYVEKAVNCHDELVEALKEVIKERDFYFVHPKAKEMINKALKKASQ